MTAQSRSAPNTARLALGSARPAARDKRVGPGRASFGSLRYITVPGGHAAMRRTMHRMEARFLCFMNSNASAVTREAEEHWGRY